jgi:hypothetical protein
MTVSEGADEGARDRAGDEAANIEGGDGAFGEIFFVSVNGVDVGGLASSRRGRRRDTRGRASTRRRGRLGGRFFRGVGWRWRGLRGGGPDVGIVLWRGWC